MSATLAGSVATTQAEDQESARRVAASRRRRRAVQDTLIRLASLAIFLGLWQLLGAHVNSVLFTTPWAVALAAVDMIRSGELLEYLLPSLQVLAYGLAISCVSGIIVGLVLARSHVLDVALSPYITFLYATPSVALVPIIVLWAGYDVGAKTIILVLFAFFPVVINTFQGVRNVDERLLEVGHSFRCSERQLWAHIILPGALPFIVTGLRLAVGRGLIGMVLADLYTAISGIGYLIVRNASTYQVDRMFVPVVTIGLLGVALNAVLHVLERRVAPWTARRQD
jgi:NitT/TauT family transport system permease protein